VSDELAETNISDECESFDFDESDTSDDFDISNVYDVTDIFDNTVSHELDECNTWGNSAELNICCEFDVPDVCNTYDDSESFETAESTTSADSAEFSISDESVTTVAFDFTTSTETGISKSSEEPNISDECTETVESVVSVTWELFAFAESTSFDVTMFCESDKRTTSIESVETTACDVSNTSEPFDSIGSDRPDTSARSDDSSISDAWDITKEEIIYADFVSFDSDALSIFDDSNTWDESDVPDTCDK
jgi:hypothetical protein